MYRLASFELHGAILDVKSLFILIIYMYIQFLFEAISS